MSITVTANWNFNSYIFLCYSCQYPWRKRGAESLNTSPGVDRRTSASKAQTAPVTVGFVSYFNTR